MSWSQPPDPKQPAPRPGDPGWVQVPPDQWPSSAPASPPPPQPVSGVPPAGYVSPYPYVATKRRGCGCSTLGCLIALVVIVAIVVPIVAVIASFGAANNAFGGDFLSQIQEVVNVAVNPNAALGLSTTELPGDANAFDPFVALAAVTAFAGEGAQLAEIEAMQVRSDGTQNLNATYDPPVPRTEYTFYREVPRPADAPPVGAGGTTSGAWYEPITIEAYRPGQMSQIRRTGGGISISTQFVNQGLKREAEDPTSNLSFFEGFVEPPACTTRQLWALALEEGAPADAVATITYDGEGYQFSISGAGFSMDFDANCKPR
jgi:hypothetical protein